jgi:hypothetical protein
MMIFFIAFYESYLSTVRRAVAQLVLKGRPEFDSRLETSTHIKRKMESDLSEWRRVIVLHEWLYFSNNIYKKEWYPATKPFDMKFIKCFQGRER